MITGNSALEEEERALLEAVSRLKLARLPQVLEITDGKRPAMDMLLKELDQLLLDFNSLISDKHFDHRTDVQQSLVANFGRGELMRFRVRHITHYKYASRVSHCYNLANVIPRDTERQRCLKIASRCRPALGNAKAH